MSPKLTTRTSHRPIFLLSLSLVRVFCQMASVAASQTTSQTTQARLGESHIMEIIRHTALDHRRECYVVCHMLQVTSCMQAGVVALQTLSTSNWQQ